MQVSWIDEDELRALAASLQDAFPSPPPREHWSQVPASGSDAGASELSEAQPTAEVADGLIASLMDSERSPAAADPVRPDLSASGSALASSAPAPAPAPVANEVEDPEMVDYGLPNLPPEPEPEPESISDEGLPEVAMIREQLKVIRERAEEAGLMPRAAEVPSPVHGGPFDPASATTGPAQAPALALPQAQAQAPSGAPQWALAAEAPVHPNFPALAQAVASITESEPHGSGAAAHPPTPGNENGAENAAPPSSASADFVLRPAGTMAERLDRFTQWAGDLTRAEQIILMDDYGDLLWGNPETNDLILTTMLALSASSRAQAAELKGPGFLRSRLSNDRDLYAMPGNTRYGTVTLALINPTGTETMGMASRLHEALVKSIEG
jgi:hypothetical protein